MFCWQAVHSIIYWQAVRSIFCWQAVISWFTSKHCAPCFVGKLFTPWFTSKQCAPCFFGKLFIPLIYQQAVHSMLCWQAVISWFTGKQCAPCFAGKLFPAWFTVKQSAPFLLASCYFMIYPQVVCSVLLASCSLHDLLCVLWSFIMSLSTFFLSIYCLSFFFGLYRPFRLVTCHDLIQ